MRNFIQGGKCALLFVLIFVLCGCSGRGEVYVAGAVRTQESAGAMSQGTAEVQPGKSEETASRDSAETQPRESVGTAGSDAEERSEGQQETAEKGAGSEPGNSPAQKDVQEEVAESGAGEPESEGYVYVCGAVENPGVYPVREGMRVFEALELAGGFAQDADREWLNQAERIQDGQRLYVYTREEIQKLREAAQETGQVPGSGTSGTMPAGMETVSGNAAATSGEVQGSADGKINLNTADREELKTLPGIGDAKADAIVRYREEHGPFGSIEEIQNISGIKSAVFSKIRDLITV